MKTIKSPYKSECMVSDQDTLHRGELMAADVARWMEKNKDAFYFILATVQDIRARGQRGRIRDYVATECIRAGFKVGETSFGFGNAYWAGIARYLVLVDPRLMNNPVMLSESCLDAYGLLPISYLPQLEVA